MGIGVSTRARGVGLFVAAALGVGVSCSTAAAATPDEILAGRPFAPTDLAFMDSGFYPNAPATATASGPGPDEAQAGQLLDAYLLAEFPSDPAARAEARAVYDSDAAKAKVAAPSARAALAALTGTIGEPAIAHILSATTPGGQPMVTRVVYANTPTTVYGYAATTNSGQTEIELNDDYTADNPFLFTSVLAHEALHQDTQNGSAYEEATNNSLDSLVYLRQLNRHPELAQAGTGLSRFINTLATARLNSGSGSHLGLFASNGNAPVLPGSSKDYRSFWDAYDPVLTPTPGNELLGTYLAAIHQPGAPECSSAEFSRALLDCIDANGNDGLTSDELVAAANALRLDTGAAAPGESPACTNARDKLTKVKAKLKRLRQHHASDKAIAKAKNKVKKAKDQVRSACAT